MIKTESITLNGLNLTYTYSDEGRYVVRDGIDYGEAYDSADTNRTYTEGRLIEGSSDAEELLNILTGGAE